MSGNERGNGSVPEITPELWRQEVAERDAPSAVHWLLPRPGAESAPSVRLPVVRLRRGHGPRVLVVGGTHGDEFEGQLAVAALARRLASLDVRGEITLLPRHNPEACLAGTRVAPGDGEDLNRLYPGRGGPTAAHAIAGAVTEHLLPGLDWLIDLHSGGTEHEFVPSSNLQAAVGSDDDRQLRPALRAFGTPWAILFDETGTDSMPHAGTLEAAARAHGARALSSELGGGARLSRASLALATTGLLDLLVHVGALGERHRSARRVEPRWRSLHAPEHYVALDVAGAFAPAVDLGDEVGAGDVVGHLHPLAFPDADPDAGPDAGPGAGPGADPGADPGAARWPREVRARSAGTVVALACRARLDAGDVAAMVAAPA